MDPYLEHPGYWRDFHQRFITYWRDWLLDRLPDHYDARIDERVGRLNEHSWGNAGPLPAPLLRDAAPVEREPAPLGVRYAEEEVEGFIRITHRPDSSLVAVLQLLSPTNKQADSRALYLAKRNGWIAETVHLVELDLLLGGRRMPIEGKVPPGDYYAYVARGDQRPLCEVYHWSLTERLTRIRLPLKPSDPDVVFDLPGLLAHAYQRGRYARKLPYAEPPPVALSETNAKWVAERLKQWRDQKT
jgi:hypothetical protein